MAHTKTFTTTGPRTGPPKGVFMGTIRLTGDSQPPGSASNAPDGVELAEVYDDGVFGKGIDVGSMNAEEKTAFLRVVGNTMQTHLSQYDPLPNVANGEETVTEGIKSLFKESEVVRRADGGYLSKLKFRNVRHAEGYHNTGAHITADAHLTPLGKQQSVDMGLLYSATNMPVSDFDFVSTLVRCKETRDEIYSSLSLDAATPPCIRTSVFQENPHSYIRGVPGPSSVDPSLIPEDAILWNGRKAEGREDLLAPVLNESRDHMSHRVWEGLGTLLKSASVYTGHTGNAAPVVNVFGHADYFRALTTGLRSLAGVTSDDHSCGYFNTEIKEFEVWVDTDKDGVISVVPQDDEQGSLVTFGKGIIPDFGVEYLAIQAKERTRQQEVRDMITKICGELKISNPYAASQLSADTANTPAVTKSDGGALLAELQGTFDTWLRSRNGDTKSSGTGQSRDTEFASSNEEDTGFPTSIHALC